jgi:hypothetical protein
VAGGEGVEGSRGGALDGREERLEALVGLGAIAGAVPQAWWLKEAFRASRSRSNGSASRVLRDPRHRCAPTADGPATFPTRSSARGREALDWLIR